MDAYEEAHSFSPSEHDADALERAGRELGAEVLLWGRVNQYTPYRFDRWAPATPPYVEVTLFAFQTGHHGVAKASGHVQGGIPATIWSRQPTFADVARPVVEKLLSDLADREGKAGHLNELIQIVQVAPGLIQLQPTDHQSLRISRGSTRVRRGKVTRQDSSPARLSK